MDDSELSDNSHETRSNGNQRALDTEADEVPGPTEAALAAPSEASEDEEEEDLEMKRARSIAKGKGPAEPEPLLASASADIGDAAERDSETPELEILRDRSAHSLVFHSRKLSSGSLARRTSGSDSGAPGLDHETPASGTRPKGKRKQDESVHSASWIAHKKHFFVLSAAGKPIYSRYGDESDLAPFTGVLSTLIAFFAAEDDSLRSLRAGDHSFVFLLRWPLYLLCVSRTGESEGQLRDQLRTLHSGFISLVTASQLHRAFEQKIGYDLRNMLGGTDGYLDSLPKRMHRDLGYLLSAVHSLRLSPGSRQKIGTAMALSRPKHLVFALLIAKGKLVTLVRPRAHPLNPSDLHLVLNLLASNPSFRSPQAGESWSPICLPKFNSRGFLHGYIAPLAEDLTLVGLSTEREGFWDLQGWKESLVATLEAKGLLQQLDQATRSDPYSLESAGIPLFHHFIYKSRSLVQYTQPAPEAPYERDEMRRHLVRLYSTVVRCVKPPVHVTVGPSVAPAIVVHKRFEKEAVVGLVDGEREVYGICSPLATAKEIKDALEQIRRWGKKLEAELFVLGAPTF